MEQIKSDKVYLDYLDHTVSGTIDINNIIDRLRFDLLLFSEDILCLSVPACVKLKSSTIILMDLDPFWNNGKIRLILDKKHKNNPWNYFNNRKRILERSFSEEQLISHFEYLAYNSEHTNCFYNIYIKEIVQTKNDLYIGKLLDTDHSFRQSVITQTNSAFDNICSHLPFSTAMHMFKVLNELILIAEDKSSLFQRSAVEIKLRERCGALLPIEVKVINSILDKGFAYANGISSYAAPISLINNRLTGKTFINILKAADYELYMLIKKLDWYSLYDFSVNTTWLDFTDHLNKLLIIYQDSKKHKNSIYPPSYIEGSLITLNIIHKIYETAMENLQKEIIKRGGLIIDVLNLKEHTDKTLERYLTVKSDYYSIIRKINELIPALKTIIRSSLRNRMVHQKEYVINI